jgi:hypothetical protein
MSDFFRSLTHSDIPTALGGPELAALSLLIAFCLGHIVSWTYMITHSGLSYSQMFTSSLLVLPVIVAMTMMLLSGNLLIAVGLLSIFAMIRFRNVLKDTRDTTFILWAVVEGVAAGTQRFSIAIVGGLMIALVFGYVRATHFGSRNRYDVVLSLQWSGDAAADSLKGVFRRHAVYAQLASQHDADEARVDISYRVLLRDPSRSRELVNELETTPGVERVVLFHRTDEAEV